MASVVPVVVAVMPGGVAAVAAMFSLCPVAVVANVTVLGVAAITTTSTVLASIVLAAVAVPALSTATLPAVILVSAGGQPSQSAGKQKRRRQEWRTGVGQPFQQWVGMLRHRRAPGIIFPH